MEIKFNFIDVVKMNIIRFGSGWLVDGMKKKLHSANKNLHLHFNFRTERLSAFTQTNVFIKLIAC